VSCVAELKLLRLFWVLFGLIFGGGGLAWVE
jgi:hypothetical protein